MFVLLLSFVSPFVLPWYGMRRRARLNSKGRTRAALENAARLLGGSSPSPADHRGRRIEAFGTPQPRADQQ